MKEIAIYGAGGYGREVACLINTINKVKHEWCFIGFFDDGLPVGHENKYGRILGGISCLNNWDKKVSIVMAIGNPSTLQCIISKINNDNVSFPNIVAPDVLFFDEQNTKMGIGNVIGFRCTISCNVVFGNFNLLNNDILIGHDCKIDSYNMFNPSCRISGEVVIGNNNFFGVASVVLQHLKIGSNVTLGANSTLIRKPKDKSIYFGSPATLLMN